MSVVSEFNAGIMAKLRRSDEQTPAGEKNEILAHEWLALETLWAATKPHVKDEELKSKIEKLIAGASLWRSSAEEWRKLNEAQQAVGLVLVEPQLTTEFMALREVARARKFASLAVHESNSRLFDAMDEGDKALPARRAAYGALLDDLQRGFIDTRFNRRLRGETASRLLRLGLLVMAGSVLPFLVYFIAFSVQFRGATLPVDGAMGHKLFSSNPVFGLWMVAAFGVLGAYFSRIMRFQANIATFGFDQVMSEYQPRMLYVRLLYGMIGAFIFYFLLRSGILGGTAFPNLENISIGEQIVWVASKTSIAAPSDAARTLEPSGLSILAPTADLAKLLVWSFLAGFSERLVPDALDRTEARTNENDGR